VWRECIRSGRYRSRCFDQSLCCVRIIPGTFQVQHLAFRIAYNCYIDRCRKPRAETVPTDTPQALNVTSGEETDAGFKYQQLYQALDSLQEKEKAAIILHYFEDLSIKEIASILQIPSGTVKYHLSTGRTRLKSLLQ
jgi:RNA polymerase sigma-70 factor (ECF subfamily)